MRQNLMIKYSITLVKKIPLLFYLITKKNIIDFDVQYFHGAAFCGTFVVFLRRFGGVVPVYPISSLGFLLMAAEECVLSSFTKIYY